MMASPAAGAETRSERAEIRRSLVRIIITYMFAFGFTAVYGAMIARALLSDPPDFRIAVELAREYGVLATVVITYWFATRRPGEASGKTPDQAG